MCIRSWQKGVILSLGGLDDDAVSQLKTALQLQPLLLSARYDLAMQYQKMERLDEAKTQLQFILDVLKQNNLESSDAYTQVQEAMDAVKKGAPVDETTAPEDGSALDVPQEDVSVEGDYNLPADTATDTPTGE